MKLNYKFVKYLGEAAFMERFATQEEAKKSLADFDFTGGSRSKTGGIPLFSNGSHGKVDASDDHSLIIGTTGSMKTRALILPTIISLSLAGENMVILDPKGEIYDKTSGFLHHEGYVVNALNFRDLKHSDCWNPLHEPYHLINDDPSNSNKVNRGKSLVNDIIAIISGLNEKRGQGNDPFWPIMGKEFVEGITSLLVMGSEDEGYCHFSNLATFINAGLESSDSEGNNTFKSFLDQFPDSFSIKQKLSSIVGTSDHTKTSIVSTGKSLLTPFFSNKEIEFILSQNTINLHDYANAKKKVVTYVIIPEEKPTYNFISTIFIRQLYAILIGDAENNPNQCLPKRVNFILDEFANIPKIEDMDNMISAARSRNIRFYLVLQCNSQLHAKYGSQDGTTIKNNCQNWIYLNSRERELIQEVQDLIGQDPNDALKPAVSVNDLLGIKKNFPSVRSLVVRKDGKPFVTDLIDITKYDLVMDNGKPIFEALNKTTKKDYIMPLEFSDFIMLYDSSSKREELIKKDDIENYLILKKSSGGNY